MKRSPRSLPSVRKPELAFGFPFESGFGEMRVATVGATGAMLAVGLGLGTRLACCLSFSLLLLQSALIPLKETNGEGRSYPTGGDVRGTPLAHSSDHGDDWMKVSPRGVRHHGGHTSLWG